MTVPLIYRFGPWFTEPVIAGLTEDNKPFLSGMDLIGAPVFAHDFVVAGTCTSNLHGMCEAMYRPNMVCHNSLWLIFRKVDTNLSFLHSFLMRRIRKSCLRRCLRVCLPPWIAMRWVDGGPSFTSCMHILCIWILTLFWVLVCFSSFFNCLSPIRLYSTPEGVTTRKLKCRQD